MSPILVDGLVELFSTTRGGFLSFLGPCTVGVVDFVLAAALWFWAEFYSRFRRFRCFCTPRYTLKTIFRVSLRQNTTKPFLKSFAPVVFAYNKRLPSSWNFYSVGRKMDELGNFGHVAVPIMEFVYRYPSLHSNGAHKTSPGL